jgi:hypothetical protein
MEKDEIGFDLAPKKKVCGQRKNFVINSFVNGRSQLLKPLTRYTRSCFKQFRLLIAFINKLVY